MPDGRGTWARWVKGLSYTLVGVLALLAAHHVAGLDIPFLESLADVLMRLEGYSDWNWLGAANLTAFLLLTALIAGGMAITTAARTLVWLVRQVRSDNEGRYLRGQDDPLGPVPLRWLATPFLLLLLSVLAVRAGDLLQVS